MSPLRLRTRVGGGMEGCWNKQGAGRSGSPLRPSTSLENGKPWAHMSVTLVGEPLRYGV